MNKLVFETKAKRMYDFGDDQDVAIAIANTGTKRVAIKIRQYSLDKLTKSGYIELAPYKNRLYFKEGDSKTGWKAVINGNSHQATMLIQGNDRIYSWCSDVTGNGNFELEYDDKFGLYYIEKVQLDFETK